jgi:hypothetical protein
MRRTRRRNLENNAPLQMQFVLHFMLDERSQQLVVVKKRPSVVGNNSRLIHAGRDE